jgi:hypothetical protein
MHVLFRSFSPVINKDVCYGEGKVVKSMRALIIAGAICCLTATLSAQVYYEDDYGEDLVNNLSINNGDHYWYVDADETSVIDISGGEVEELWTFESSTADVGGGESWRLYALDDSTINVADGKVWELFSEDNSSISITGGEVEWLSVSFNSEVIISDGRITNLWAQDSSVVDITGQDFSYDPYFYWDALREEWEGLLTGFWYDDTPLSIITWDEGTYDHITLHDEAQPAPEPTTLLLLGLGGLLLRRKA